jgi:site-specific DNA recombinase
MEDKPATNMRAALYARVSTEEQRQGQTIDSQIAELERFAREKEWIVVHIYRDEGWSGGILARPDLDHLRDDASKGLFGIVLVNDVDRLARDVTHLGVIKRDLERHGLEVIFKKLPTEKSPTHNLMVNILGSFAEFERELIADRTRRGRRHKVEVRKEFLGSIPPYGFRYIRKDHIAGQGGRLEVNPEEARVVRKMFAWVDTEGLSARKVMNRLNQSRLPPRKGKACWAKSSVLRILRGEIYAGVWHYNKLQAYMPTNPSKDFKYRKSLKSSSRLRPRDEWLPVELPEALRLIPRDQWRRVQLQINRNIAFSPRNEKHAYLLKGLVRCSGCGARYVGQPSHGKFYYRCIARCKKVPTIQEHLLNETVWKAVKEAMLNPNLIAEQVTELSQNQLKRMHSTTSEIAEIEQARLQIQNEEARLLEAYRMEILSPAQLGRELEKIKRRQFSTENKETELSQAVHKLSLPAIKKSITDYCRIAGERLQSFNPEERQRFIRFLIRNIVFCGSTVRVRGVIPHSTDGGASNRESIEAQLRDGTSSHIATTEIDERGRNTPLIFQGFGGLSALEDDNQDFTFELVQAIPRLPHARRPKACQSGKESGEMTQLAA